MKTIKNLYNRIKKTINLPEMGLLPGNLAFFLVLAVIPTMTLITYGASMLNLSTDFLYDFLAKAFSLEMASLMLSTGYAVNAGLKLAIVLVVCYYIASNGMDSIIVTSNTIYGIKNGNWLKRRIKAILMAVIFVILIVFMLVIPIFGNQIISLIRYVNLNDNVTLIITKIYIYLKSPIVWLLLFFLIKILYVIAPDRKVKGHNANYGAFFTTISWIIITALYAYYINNIANYSAFYGGLTSICVLMIWFYFLSFSFVIGMSLNYQRENEKLEKTASINNSK